MLLYTRGGPRFYVGWVNARTIRSRSASDKEVAAIMASMVSKSKLHPVLRSLALTAAPAALALGLAPQTAYAQVEQPPLDQQQLSWYRAQMGLSAIDTSARPPSNSVAESVLQWRRFNQSDNLNFSEVASFLMRNPGWPGESRLRRIAEQALPVEGYVPAQALDYFAKYPPLTASGRARQALALLAAGRRDEANAAARRAWTSGSLTLEEERRLLTLFPGALTPSDHDARMDALLWANRTGDAQRQLGYVSAQNRQIFDARLALRSGAVDAAMKMAAVDAIARNDPGYLVDKATWLRGNGQSAAARSLLAAPRTLTRLPTDLDRWYDTLLVNAKAASNDRQSALAYSIASQIDDALPPGAVIRDESASVRDVYTDLAWLAGQTAYYELGRPADAIGMFRRYAEAPGNPALKAKGYYWAARAAIRANQRDNAQLYFTKASDYPDTFYGQLALEQLGRPVPSPHAPAVEVSQAERNAFADSGIVQATRVLGQIGARQDQTQFLRAIAANAETLTDHVLAAELANRIGRPDLGVMVARSSRVNGYEELLPAYYPTVSVPGDHGSNWTMIHAIVRQESQFDREATSRVGARGMMQLMPATAREVAGKLGLAHSQDRLHSDPQYNITLGSTYFQQMLRYYGGSYPLAVAAYNGGPGNVNRWLRENGDPRAGGVDILKWIEDIPLAETKYYVQYVLSNAVMYDQIRQANGGKAPDNLLSFYLGKRNPG